MATYCKTKSLVSVNLWLVSISIIMAMSLNYKLKLENKNNCNDYYNKWIALLVIINFYFIW